MVQTAVEWLEKKLLKDNIFLKEDWELFQQAKEKEKQQAQNYAEFAIKCDIKGMKILEFDGYINLENNEKFNK